MDDRPGSGIRTSAEIAEDAALPQVHVAHADPDSPAHDIETPSAVVRQPLAAKSPARWAYERLALYMQTFEKSLDAEQELAMGFAGTAAGVLRIEGIGYFDPDIVSFYGTDETGTRTQLIQHVGQLNVLLRAMPRPDPQQAPRRIGFRLARDLEDGAGDPPPAAPDSAEPGADPPPQEPGRLKK